MFGYSLWTNWTTFYFVDVHHLTLAQASRYCWIRVYVCRGGRFRRRMAFRASHRARHCSAIGAHSRLSRGAALSLVTAAIPAAHTPAWAAAGISLSFFAVSAMSVNIYSLPLDAFGGGARGLRDRRAGRVLWRDANS